MIIGIRSHLERQNENLDQAEEFLQKLLESVKENKEESDKM